MQPEWNLRHGRLLVLALCSFLFVYLILALTEIGSGAGCHWAFPRWFGCVLGLHETLAAGLMGAAGVLIAAWMAWTAVQQQINADRERTVADRKEAERLLAEDLTNYADGMAAAWRELLAVPNPTPEPSLRVNHFRHPHARARGARCRFQIAVSFFGFSGATPALPHSASVMSSTRRTETPARYISIKASSTELSRRR